MAKLRDALESAVIVPSAEVTIPLRMDSDPFHRDELLTAFIFIQVILTRHYTVLPRI